VNVNALQREKLLTLVSVAERYKVVPHNYTLVVYSNEQSLLFGSGAVQVNHIHMARKQQFSQCAFIVEFQSIFKF
jgi:hypothetical protein